MKPNNTKEYDTDFYAWTQHMAELIRKGKFAEIDAENVAEEIESMGRGERRELINRLAILICHLLKWQFQSVRRGNSWKFTIKAQRHEIQELIEDSPSLKHELHEKLELAYNKAIVKASYETGFTEDTFPKQCPFTLEQCLDNEFFPE